MTAKLLMENALCVKLPVLEAIWDLSLDPSTQIMQSQNMQSEKVIHFEVQELCV